MEFIPTDQFLDEVKEVFELARENVNLQMRKVWVEYEITRLEQIEDCVLKFLEQRIRYSKVKNIQLENMPGGMSRQHTPIRIEAKLKIAKAETKPTSAITDDEIDQWLEDHHA